MPSKRSSGPRQQGQPPQRQRRTLSCLPCRIYKLRCDRSVPCRTCSRYGREDRCRQNPPPANVLTRQASHQNTDIPVRPDIRLTPSESPISQQLSDSLVTGAADVTGTAPVLSPLNHARANRQLEAADVPESDSHHHGHIPETPSSLAVSSAPSWQTSVRETVASTVAMRSQNLPNNTLLDEPVAYWKRYLVDILPSQNQCDMFVAYFFENINWTYQAIHAPSFRAEYAAFWTTPVEDVDLIWLSLLYMILCLGAFFIPSQVAEVGAFEAADLTLLHRRWYSASRQALHYGGHDARPTVTQLQVFLISQTYWYSTKTIETLNSHMAQAVRNAQALGLDEPSPPSMNPLQREMRHRIWWDIVSSDTFQSVCLGRPPLLQSHLSTVPFPSNCRDEDITASHVHVRPLQEPTEMSIHHVRAVIFKILNKLYINNGANLSSYEFVAGIDSEISAVMDTLPWYLREDPTVVSQRLSKRLATLVNWMRHILHNCICVQRIRMYRPFLNPRVGDAWQRCMEASESALSVYKCVRNQDITRFKRSQKMYIHAYQTFSAAVSLSVFLLVEMPPNVQSIKADIEMVIEDLHFHSSSAGDLRRIPLISDGWNVIRRILALYDIRRNHMQKPRNTGALASSKEPDDAPTALVPAISSVFGGESSAYRYLERCAIDYIVTGSAENLAGRSGSATSLGTGQGLDGLGDLAHLSQWGDAWWPDIDLILAINTDVI